MKKHTIWNELIDLGDWRDDLREEYPDADDDELYGIASEMNDEYLEDDLYELNNLDVNGKIIAFGELGLWNGTHQGYMELHHNDAIGAALLEVLCPGFHAYHEIYVNEHRDLCVRQTHHDGVNYITLRSWKPDVDDEAQEYLLDRAYRGGLTRADLDRYTDNLGDVIAKFYGWED